MLVQLRAALDAATALPGASEPGLIARDQPAPLITGTTLDGEVFTLADLRGRPVIINFWGPSCVPCRDEFPLFRSVLESHEAEGLAIIGVLMYDAPAPARDFIDEFQASWPTVDDPAGEIRNAYRVAARPQSYFIDRDGILRSIQVGELTQEEFDRQYALIARPSSTEAPAEAIPASLRR